MPSWLEIKPVRHRRPCLLVVIAVVGLLIELLLLIRVLLCHLWHLLKRLQMWLVPPQRLLYFLRGRSWLRTLLLLHPRLFNLLNLGSSFLGRCVLYLGSSSTLATTLPLLLLLLLLSLLLDVKSLLSLHLLFKTLLITHVLLIPPPLIHLLFRLLGLHLLSQDVLIF